MTDLFVIAIYLSFALDFIVFPIPSEASTIAITQRTKSKLNSKTIVMWIAHVLVLLTWLYPLAVAIAAAAGAIDRSASWLFYVGIALAFLGRIITISTSLTLSQLKKSSATVDLQTMGWFALSRHPIVLGLHITLAGLLLTVGMSWLLLPYLLTLIYFDDKLNLEETLLRETFGTAYEHYTIQTHRYLNWPWKRRS